MPSYKHTRPYIKEEYFKIPRKQVFYDYFPDFLKKALDEYVKIYHDNLLPQIDHKIIPSGRKMNFLYRNIKILCTKIIKTIDFYYQGKIFEASKCFNECLDKLMFDDIKPYETITDNVVFYRARVSNGKQFKKKDLFHIDFISRHLVSTNRYSIPGFPALYLGDSSYVCWEEFNRPLIKDLWFFRFENKEELNIIKFQRIEEFLQEMDSSDLKNIEKYIYLLKYVAIIL